MKTALEERESDTSQNMIILTKVALDSVFAHADAKCETRMTLKSHQRENVVRKRVHTRGEMERTGESCTYRVADNCDRATRRLPCWRK
jgi:hypothetical protein